jgi:GTPase SAR1 family protein
MPETAFVKVASRSAVVSLSATQSKVAQLPLDAKAVVYGSPGSGKTTALKALYLAKVAQDNPARVETHEVSHRNHQATATTHHVFCETGL